MKGFLDLLFTGERGHTPAPRREPAGSAGAPASPPPPPAAADQSAANRPTEPLAAQSGPRASTRFDDRPPVRELSWAMRAPAARPLTGDTRERDADDAGRRSSASASAAPPALPELQRLLRPAAPVKAASAEPRRSPFAAARGPAPRESAEPRGPRRRLVLVDLGELRARAHGYDVTDGEPVLVGRVEHESAVCPGDLPDRVGAPRGMDAGTSDRVEAPIVIADPAGSGAPGGEPRWLLVGAPAATLGGHEALVAHAPDEARLEALLHALVFPLVRDGDAVELACVDGPNGAARPLEALLARWDGHTQTIRGLCRQQGAIEARSVHVTTRRIPSGAALLELAYARGLIVEEGAPILLVDLGHQNVRVYLMDFACGLLDLDVIPHGGKSFLTHAHRYAEERRWRPGGDVDLLRQLEAGTDMLSFGGMSFVTRTFFEIPRQELLKAIVAGVAARLRHHVERGGHWPAAMLLTGGPARAFAADLAERLAARGMRLAEVDPLEPRPSPVLEGALCAWRLGVPA